MLKCFSRTGLLREFIYIYYVHEIDIDGPFDDDGGKDVGEINIRRLLGTIQLSGLGHDTQREKLIWGGAEIEIFP